MCSGWTSARCNVAETPNMMGDLVFIGLVCLMFLAGVAGVWIGAHIWAALDLALWW